MLNFLLRHVLFLLKIDARLLLRELVLLSLNLIQVVEHHIVDFLKLVGVLPNLGLVLCLLVLQIFNLLLNCCYRCLQGVLNAPQRVCQLILQLVLKPLIANQNIISDTLTCLLQ